MKQTMTGPFSAALAGLALFAATPGAHADDALLREVTGFTESLLAVEADVPGFVVGAVRDGETVVLGAGRASDTDSAAPDGDTLIPIGSISKVFTGATFASLVADGVVGFADPLAQHLGVPVEVPTLDGNAIRLIDLATHASGLPREYRAPDDFSGDIQAKTEGELLAALEKKTLLFPPGSGILYSNFAYDLLAIALSNTAGKPYAALLKERVLDPAGMTSTGFNLHGADMSRALQGHLPDGSAVPETVTTPMVEGSGSLISTANDMLKWLGWHLDRFSAKGAELRLLDHAVYLQPDGLKPISGVEEFGPISAIGLGWIVLAPEANRPLILEKTGGFRGVLSYVAFAPNRGVGVFVAINKYDFAAFDKVVQAANGLIAELSPR